MPASRWGVTLAALASLVALHGCSGAGTGPGIVAPTVTSTTTTSEIPPLPTIAGRDTTTATALSATPVPTQTSTPLPAPTATPIPARAASDNIVLIGSHGRATMEGTFSDASSDVDTSHFVSALDSLGSAYNVATNIVQLGCTQRTNTYRARTFALEFKSPGGFHVGQVLPVTNSSAIRQNVSLYYIVQPNSPDGRFGARYWKAQSGSLRVTARASNRISIALQNVRFEIPTADAESDSFFTFNGNATLTF